MQKSTIAVIGLWHLGEIFSTGLAELGHSVVGIDSDQIVVANLQKGIPPLDEPELKTLLKKNLTRKRLSFSNNFEDIKKCNIIWLALDTPVTEHDEVDLQPIWDFFKLAVSFFKQKTLIVISSQIPVGTSEAIQKFIQEKRPKLSFDLAYVPENLQLGQAVKSFFKPKRIVVGVSKKTALKKIELVFKPLHTTILPMNIASAELSKHALNSFLATSLSFIYDIADMAKAYGADVVDVTRALRSDERIGPAAYLDASVGFSGGTLARDLKTLLGKARAAKLPLPVIKAVFEKNRTRRNLLVTFLERHLGTLRNKKIALFGLTYKPGTSTLRRALSLEVLPLLTRRGAAVTLFDPAVNEEELFELTGLKNASSVYECAHGCQAILVLTGWSEFKKINFRRLHQIMRRPALFYDAKNFLADEAIKISQSGFLYGGVGR